MTTAHRAAKKGSRKAPLNQRAPAKGYVALHSTDASATLAAGFILPPDPESSAGDPSAKVVLVSSSPVLASLLARACAGRDYGFPLLAEVEFPGRPPDESGQWTSIVDFPLPIAHVHRFVFRTKEELDEFRARASGYADVPIDSCDHVVAPDCFSTDVAVEVVAPVNVPAVVSDAAFSRHSKIGGAIAAYLAATRDFPDRRAIDWLRTMIEEPGRRASLQGVVEGLARAMGAGNNPDEQLVGAAADVLESADAGSGFRRQEFLKQLSSRASATGDERHAAFVGRFIAHAEDIASARRDLADNAFGDEDGKIQARALLLFILNPDPDRLVHAPRRIKNLGPRVYFLAAALAGGFGGLARLPAVIKAPDRQALLGLTLLVSALARGEGAAMEGKIRWKANGVRQETLEVGGHEVARAEMAPAALLARAHELASRLGLESCFLAQTGELEVRSAKVAIPIQLDGRAVPTIPGAGGLRATARIASKMGAKKLAEIVGSINEKSQDTGIFARAHSSNRDRMIEVFATCLSSDLSEGALEKLLAAVCSAATQTHEVIGAAMQAHEVGPGPACSGPAGVGHSAPN